MYYGCRIGVMLPAGSEEPQSRVGFWRACVNKIHFVIVCKIEL